MAQADKIKTQVEFYFSDSNFRKDAFLRAAAESDPEGFVPISVLLTFNRLKQHTTDVAVVADALKESTMVTLSEDKLKVKRSIELPANDDSASRTLYVKGFPTDDADFTIEAIQTQFSQFGKVLLVKLRRFHDRALKGSVFIEFESVESMQAANNAANVDGEVKLSFKETPFLCVMPYSEWSERKKANMEKRKKTEKKEDNKETKDNEKEEEEDEGYEQGLVVKIGNIPANLNSLSLKRFFEKYVDGFTFVEFEGSSTDAVIRFGDKSLVEKVLAGVEKGLTIRAVKGEDVEYFTVEEHSEGNKVTATVLEGEEEKAVWDKKKAAASSGEKRGRGGRGGGGRGRGGGRGGRGGRGNKKQRR